MISVDPCQSVRTMRTHKSRRMFAHCDFTYALKLANNSGMKYRIREIRNAKGWTMEKLAEMVGTSKGHISGIETGKRNPSQDMLSLIADALRVPVKELFDAETPQDARAIKHFAMYMELSSEDQAAIDHYVAALHQKASE